MPPLLSRVALSFSLDARSAMTIIGLVLYRSPEGAHVVFEAISLEGAEKIAAFLREHSQPSITPLIPLTPRTQRHLHLVTAGE